MSKPISIVSFCLIEWHDHACYTYFKFEDGMTWEQYFNSDYSKNLEGNVSFEGTCAEVYYDYDDMLTYCTPSITYTLDADNNVVLEVETLGDNWTLGGGCKGAMKTTLTIPTQMKLTDKIPNSNVGEFIYGGGNDWEFVPF